MVDDTPVKGSLDQVVALGQYWANTFSKRSIFIEQAKDYLNKFAVAEVEQGRQQGPSAREARDSKAEVDAKLTQTKHDHAKLVAEKEDR